MAGIKERKRCWFSFPDSDSFAFRLFLFSDYHSMLPEYLSSLNIHWFNKAVSLLSFHLNVHTYIQEGVEGVDLGAGINNMKLY